MNAMWVHLAVVELARLLCFSGRRKPGKSLQMWTAQRLRDISAWPWSEECRYKAHIRSESGNSCESEREERRQGCFASLFHVVKSSLMDTANLLREVQLRQRPRWRTRRRRKEGATATLRSPPPSRDSSPGTVPYRPCATATSKERPQYRLEAAETKRWATGRRSGRRR